MWCGVVWCDVKSYELTSLFFFIFQGTVIGCFANNRCSRIKGEGCWTETILVCWETGTEFTSSKLLTCSIWLLSLDLTWCLFLDIICHMDPGQPERHCQHWIMGQVFGCCFITDPLEWSCFGMEGICWLSKLHCTCTKIDCSNNIVHILCQSRWNMFDKHQQHWWNIFEFKQE